LKKPIRGIDYSNLTVGKKLKPKTLRKKEGGGVPPHSPQRGDFHLPHYYLSL
jgi:hypothetical protein